MLPVKLWFPLVLRNKNKTAEIKLFKSLYKRTPQNCGVLFFMPKCLRVAVQMEHIASIALRRGKSVFPEIPSIMTFSNRTQNSRRHTFFDAVASYAC